MSQAHIIKSFNRADRSIPLIWGLPEKFHYPMDIIQSDFKKLLSRTPFDEKNQIGLTAPAVDDRDPYKYVGSLYSYEHKKYIKQENDFNYFVDLYRDLIFFKIYQDLKELVPLGRVRLMRIEPRHCYSMHRDDNVRYHLAIKTDSQCFICFKEAGTFHIPADGKIYGSNTLLEHTALNGSLEDRVHLVFSGAGPIDNHRLK